MPLTFNIFNKTILQQTVDKLMTESGIQYKVKLKMAKFPPFSLKEIIISHRFFLLP